MKTLIQLLTIISIAMLIDIVILSIPLSLISRSFTYTYYMIGIWAIETLITTIIFILWKPKPKTESYGHKERRDTDKRIIKTININCK